ncbi:hypothetical protein HY407_00335 [Candidatus Gottesmanbacteria bacterium]|nr:hypothetical protein [Candidatus Roizmanbacteria bacterium]MBI4066807.1 hypothetical protein [Candidatus Gottesmanbacteria bacterium]
MSTEFFSLKDFNHVREVVLKTRGEYLRHLTNPSIGVYWVVGPRGSGKTSLALTAAAELKKMEFSLFLPVLDKNHETIRCIRILIFS